VPSIYICVKRMMLYLHSSTYLYPLSDNGSDLCTLPFSSQVQVNR
jgi:hypothetical protein